MFHFFKNCQNRSVMAEAKTLEKASEDFLETFDAFVSNLTRTFANEADVDDPLNKAMFQIAVIQTAVDRTERIVTLATRWHNMATVNEKNKAAFESCNESFLAANFEGASILNEMGIARVLNNVDLFPKSREIFWAYIRKLTKKAAAVVAAAKAPLPENPADFERDAQMTQVLEQMGLLAKQQKTGEINLNIKALLDPKNAQAIMRRVMKGQKGQDPEAMKAALDTVTSMMTGSQEGEAAFNKMMSQAR